MKIAVINSSWVQDGGRLVYNYAAHKMLVKFRQEGHQVFISRGLDLWALECDKAYFSAIFTWDLPQLCQDVNLLKEKGKEIEIGGPAATAMAQYVVGKTGISPHIGLDERFEHVPGDKYQTVFTSRGCPRACEFCIVNMVEGRKMVEYDNFPIPAGKNPYISDNNILATSWEHQKLVAEKLRGVKNLDFNSGFDDRIFVKAPDKYWELYRPLRFEMWRFAYDQAEQRDSVTAAVRYCRSKGIDYRHISVFCLVGGPENLSFEETQERLQHLVDIECSPYPMRMRPINSVERQYIPPGWEEGQIETLFAYYGVPWRWRSIKWNEFKKGFR